MGEGGLCRCGSLGWEEGTGAALCLGGKVGISPGGEGLPARIRRGSESTDPLSQPGLDFLSEPGFLTTSWGNPACPATEGRWPAAAFSDSCSRLAATLLAFSASLDLSTPGLCLSTWLFTLVYTPPRHPPPTPASSARQAGPGRLRLPWHAPTPLYVSVSRSWIAPAWLSSVQHFECPTLLRLVTPTSQNVASWLPRHTGEKALRTHIHSSVP